MSGETVNPEVPAHGPLNLADPEPVSVKPARELDPVFNRLAERNKARTLDLARIDPARDFVALYARADGRPAEPQLIPLYECSDDFVSWASEVVGKPGVIVAVFQTGASGSFGFAFDSDLEPAQEPEPVEGAAAATPTPGGEMLALLREEMKANREQTALLMEKLSTMNQPAAGANVDKWRAFAEEIEEEAKKMALATLRGEDPRADKHTDQTLSHVRKYLGMLKEGKEIGKEIATMTGGDNTPDPLAWLGSVEKAAGTPLGQRIVGKLLGVDSPAATPPVEQGEGDALAFA